VASWRFDQALRLEDGALDDFRRLIHDKSGFG
jgi:hypothetical protein